MSISSRLTSQFAIALALGTLLDGCTAPVAIEFFNSSGVPLVVTGCGRQLTVSPGAVGEIESAYSCLDEVHLSSGEAVWSYRFLVPSHNIGETGHSYYHSKGFLTSTLVVKLQINSDHRIFALPVGTGFPLNGKLPQPSGFPLVPLR
jgi:hypothetical protein